MSNTTSVSRPAGSLVLPPLYALYLQAAASRGAFLVISAQAEESTFNCNGYLVPPFGIPLHAHVSINAEQAHLVKFERSALMSQVYGFGDVYEFHAIVPISIVKANGGLAVIQMHPGGSSEPLADQAFAYRVGTSPLPTPEQRLRVHGATDEGSYIIQGASTAWKIKRLLKTHFAKDVASIGNILDWGCGCGRVIQHLGDKTSKNIFGCDIDADNLNWCKANIGFGEYTVTSIEPPLPYRANFFHLVFGISIFTHLNPKDEIRWVEELRRVVAPGGIALMSVHGAMTQFYHKTPEVIAAIQETGWYEVGQNVALDDSVPEPHRYRDVFHTPHRVFEIWSKYFTILDIVQGYIGSNQDLVVMTKPA